MTQDPHPKLAREDWYRMGLEALVKGGPESLKASRLARLVGVTTGSFYWHFQGVEAFRSGLLDYWEKGVVLRLIQEAKANEPDPARVLVELRRRILELGAHRYDVAMRRWAETDSQVRKTVEAADELRAAFLVETFHKGGMNDRVARDRANLVGAAWRGSLDLDDRPEYRMKLIAMAGAD